MESELKIETPNIIFSFNNKISLTLEEDGCKVTQIQTGCLAQHSYILECEKECMLVDPMRESEKYLEYIKENKLKLKNILMTHVHADFVAGHIQIQKDYEATTGHLCDIVYAEGQQNIKYAFTEVKDNHQFTLGNKQIRVMHTPGHTMESACYLFNKRFLLTGDTLFLGDVGRPDLVSGSDSKMTKEIMAGHMYNSLQRLKGDLDDSTIILTGHGSGSPCGKNIQSGSHSTLGEQKQSNYALADNLDKTLFVDTLCSQIPPPSNWFHRSVEQNLTGYQQLDTLYSSLQMNLDINSVVKQEKTKLVDCRWMADVTQHGYIANSYGVYLDLSVAQIAGQLLNSPDQLVLLCPEDHRREVFTRFTRIGYDNILGFTSDDLTKYTGQLQHIDTIPAADWISKAKEDNTMQILDVRKEGEWKNGHLANSHLFSLDRIAQQPQECQQMLLQHFQQQPVVYVMCAAGGRSFAAVHILQALSQNKFVSIAGGFNTLKKLDPILAVL